MPSTDNSYPFIYFFLFYIKKLLNSYLFAIHLQLSDFMKSMPGLPKLVQHLVDYVVVFGIEVESGLTQS